MTPPRMPDNESDEIFDMTPAYPPDGDSSDIVDMTPAYPPDEEQDEFEDMTPAYPPDEEQDEFEDMTDAYWLTSEPDEIMDETVPVTTPPASERKPITSRAATSRSRASATQDEKQSKTSRTTTSRPRTSAPQNGSQPKTSRATSRSPTSEHQPRSSRAPVAAEQDDTEANAGWIRWKVIIPTLLGIAVLLFVGNRAFGIGLPGLPGGNPGGENSGSPRATGTPTPNTIRIGNKPITVESGPLLLLNPAVVRQGTQFSVTGSGFKPGEVVDVSITQKGSKKALASVTVKADKNGTFSGAALSVPMSLSSGDFVVVAKQRNTNLTAQAIGTVAGGAPQVKLSKQVGKPGDMIVLSLNGFAPGETVNVYWNTLSGQPITKFQADGGGGLGQAKIQVPIGAVGNNTFLFVGAKSQSMVAANFLVLQLYPTIKLSSYALRADNLISFSGSGFGPGERVFVFLNNPNGQPLAVVPTDDSGAFKNAPGFVIPFELKGKQSLVFMGEQSRASIAVAFDVLPYSPQVQPSTYGGFPGTTITFYVSGFARNEVVHVYANHTKSSMGTLVSCFQTNDQGSAASAGSYLIPGDAQGTVGFALEGVKSGGIGEASVKVTPPPAPVQTPPQKPFTCPLDPPAQKSQPSQPSQPQGSVEQSGRLAALHIAAPATAYVPAAFKIADAGQFPQKASGFATSESPAYAMAERRPAVESERLLRIAGSVPDQRGISEAWTALGLMWLVIVVTLTVTLIRRSSRQEGSRRELARSDHVGVESHSASPLAARSACPDISKDNSALASHMAAGLGASGDKATREPSGSPVIYQSGGGTCLVPAPAGYNGSEETAHAVWCTATRPGKRRLSYQDTTFAMQTNLKRAAEGADEFALFLVADGRICSHTNAAASRIAVESVARHVITSMTNAPRVPTNLIMPLFKYAVTLADDALLALNAAESPDTNTTTLTGALVVGKRAYIVNVGDSRTYVCGPEGGLRQLTKDHSIAFGLISAGPIYPEVPNNMRSVRQLYYSLGGTEQPIHVDAFQMPMRPDDWLLLCSDGFWRYVADPQIEAILGTAADPSEAVQALMREVSGVECEDDISVIVVRMLAETAR